MRLFQKVSKNPKLELLTSHKLKTDNSSLKNFNSLLSSDTQLTRLPVIRHKSNLNFSFRNIRSAMRLINYYYFFMNERGLATISVSMRRDSTEDWSTRSLLALSLRSLATIHAKRPPNVRNVLACDIQNWLPKTHEEETTWSREHFAVCAYAHVLELMACVFFLLLYEVLSWERGRGNIFVMKH